MEHIFYTSMISRFMPMLEEDGGGAGGGAAGGQGAGDGGSGSGSGSNGGGDGGSGGQKNEPAGNKSFDDMMKENPGYQSELDRRIDKAVKTALGNERDRQKLIKDDLQDEVLKVSKMTDDEKDAYFKKKAEEKAAKREAELTKRELTLDARTMLAEKGLPDSFVDLLNYTDKKACTKSIETLEKAFNDAVSKAVDEKLKGNKPPKDAGTEGTKKKPEEQANEEAMKEAFKAAGLKWKE